MSDLNTQNPIPASDPSADGQTLLQQLDSCLERLLWTIRYSVILRASCWILSGAAVFCVVSLLLDRLFRLSHAGRGVLLLLALGALGYAVWRTLVEPLRRQLPYAALADLLERHFPTLSGQLRSTVAFLNEPGFRERLVGDSETDQDISDAMKRRVALDTVEGLRTIDPGVTIDAGRLGSNILSAAISVVTLLLLITLFSSSFSIWFQRQFLFGDVDWPYRTRLLIEGFSEQRLGVPRGDPLKLQVRSEGEMPSRVSLHLHFADSEARYLLTREGDSNLWVHEHASVIESFRLRVTVDDFVSDEHLVEVLERPQVEHIAVTSTPPKYTGQDAKRVEGDVGEISAATGSNLRVEILSNKDLSAARLETPDGDVALKADTSSSREYSGSWEPKTAGGITVHLTDAANVPPDQLFRFQVHLREDARPEVLASVTGIGSMITPGAELPLRVEAEDDYRLTSIYLATSNEVPEKPATAHEEALESLEVVKRRHTRDYRWEVSTINPPPGSRLDVHLGAIDNDALSPEPDLKAGKRGLSNTLSFLVVTAERFTEEIHRRQEEQRRILERLLESEKGVRDEVYEMIDASWKKDEALPESVVRRMLQLERLERQHARQLQAVAAAVQQILSEMTHNRVGEADELAHLAENILGPLEILATETLPQASRQLASIRTDPQPNSRLEKGLTLAALLEDKLESLQSVIDGMVKLETFTEIIKQLRGIIKTQKEAEEAARNSFQKLVDTLLEDEDIFDDDGDGDDDVFDDDEETESIEDDSNGGPVEPPPSASATDGDRDSPKEGLRRKRREG